MKKILLTNHYTSKPISIIRELQPHGFELIFLSSPSKSEVIKLASDADYILAGGRIPIDRQVIENSNRLRMIQRTGVGLDTLDLQFLKGKGIPVYVNFGVNSRSVAEHTIMLILSVLRKLPQVDSTLKKGIWLKHELGLECHELSGKTIGMIGMGAIGRIVAQLLKPFNVNILYYDVLRLHDNIELELNVRYCPFQEVISESDIVSLHCGLSPETTGLIGKMEIQSMKSGVIIINTSRGKLVDQDVLVEGLQSGKIGGAGLDVFSEEPLLPTNSLLKIDNVVLTPHIGGVSLQAFVRMFTEAFNNIQLFDSGKLSEIAVKRLI